MMVTSSTSPVAPSASRFCSAAKFGSKRRLKPIISGMPAFSTRASVSLMRAELEVDRLLAEHALPAAAAWSMRSAWVSVGVPISTASIALSARISSSVRTGAPVAADSALAPSGNGSAIAASLARVDARDGPAVDLADAARAEQPDGNHARYLSLE